MEQTHIGTVEVCKPLGAIVDDDSTAFARQLMERLKAQNSRVVLAMSEVPYVDSAAVEGLLNAADFLAARGARLKVAQVTPTCREIFQLTGVVNRFSIFNDVQDAVRSYL